MLLNISILIYFIKINHFPGAKFLKSADNPITPQATLGPLFPVV